MRKLVAAGRVHSPRAVAARNRARAWSTAWYAVAVNESGRAVTMEWIAEHRYAPGEHWDSYGALMAARDYHNARAARAAVRAHRAAARAVNG